MKKPFKPTIVAYVVGFVISLALTIAAYALIEIHINSNHEVFTHSFLLTAILIFAFVQVIVQLVCFLHFGRETDSRWNTVIFASTIGIVLIVIVGSIWIMNHLNYNMMASPQDMQAYIQSQDGL